ncbi:IPT/TIG domain-containing protein [Bordetella sputigena]|uniref:beta-propeller fold lactonase family protein n=1 Tax=Bordetella sputigena TaxID=1416810 RepID=UPI0039F016BD
MDALRHMPGLPRLPHTLAAPAAVILSILGATAMPTPAQATLGNKAIATVFAYDGQEPNRVAFTPDGSKAYVTNALSNTVSVIRTADGSQTQVIALPAGSTPTNIAVSPDGAKAYVLNLGSHSISIIDTQQDQLARPATVQQYSGTNPYGIAFHPDPARHLAYVTNNDAAASVSVIDTAGDKQTGTIAGYPADQGVHGVAFSPDGTKAYAATAQSVVVIDVAQGKKTQDVQGYSGTTPLNLAFVSNTKLYVVNQGSGSVSIIDAAGAKQTGTVQSFKGAYPAVVATSPGGPVAYVTNYGSNSVAVIDIAHDVQSGTVDMGNFGGLRPNGLAFRPDTNPEKAGDLAYVVNNGSNSVTIVQVRAAAAVIDKILPSSGATLGGTSVTITGSNLIDSTGVTFGGARGTNLDVISNGELTVVTPPESDGMPGAVDVVVQNGGGAGTAPGGYTYTTVFSR